MSGIWNDINSAQSNTNVIPNGTLAKVRALGFQEVEAAGLWGATLADMRAALDRVGIALVQMVTPVTPDKRLKMLCAASQGFVYAVTMTGTTGKSVAVPDEVLDYRDRVQSMSPVPVCAGFGIRTAWQVSRMRGHVDGVVVGSALVEVLERGEDPAQFLRGLKS